MNYVQQQYPADVGPHACNLCSEQFAVSSGLLVHKLSSHSTNNISSLLIDLLENEVLNSSDDDYCYSFVFTTTYYRYPNTIIKTEPILEEVAPCEIHDEMSFEVDPFEDAKPIVEEIFVDLQRPASPESTITETAPKATFIRSGSNKMRKMCPICRGRFHPQGLYRHIRLMHNSIYSTSKGRAKLVRTIDCGAVKPIAIEDIFVETQPDVTLLQEAKNETQFQQIPKSIDKNRIRKKCPICGIRFHPQGLYRHMLSMHNIKYSVRGGRQRISKTIEVMPDESNDDVEKSVQCADKEFVEDPLHSEAPTRPEEIIKRSTSHKLRKMCPICYRRFHPQGLYRHLRVMHNTVYSTASGRSKIRTINVSNAEASFVACDVADAVQIKAEVDAADPDIVTNEKLNRNHKIRKICPICGVRLHPQGLYQHLRVVHNTRYSVTKGKVNLQQTTVEESSTEKPTMSPIIKKRRKCPLCDRFYHQHALSRHLQSAHDQSKAEIASMHRRFRAQPLKPLTPTPHPMSIEPEQIVEASKKLEFVCPMCDAKLECQHSFREHLRQNHQFPISTTENLIDPKQSRRILTSNLRPCPLCGCGLHPQSITRHLRSIHKSSKEEVLALSQLMRVRQKRREAQIWKTRQNTDDPKDSDNGPVLS